MQCPDVEYCGVPLENRKCPAAVLQIHCGTLGCLPTRFGNHRFRESACFLYTTMVLESLGQLNGSHLTWPKEKNLNFIHNLGSDISRGVGQLEGLGVGSQLAEMGP